MSSGSKHVRRLKYAVDACVNGVWGDEPNGADDLVVVRVADFDRSKGVVELGEAPTVRAVPISARNRRVLQPGDLLIEKSGGGEQQPVGNVVLFHDDRLAICSNFVARMTVADDCDSRFVAYVFRCLYAEGRNIPHIKQTSGIQNLDSESYLNERAWLPSKSEQERIANFLGEQTARIDALIAEKERLVDTLHELHRSTLWQQVTKGVAGAVTRGSGVEWIGQCPTHWEVKAIKWLSPVLRGASPRPIDDPKYFDENGEYGWVRIADVSASDGLLTTTEQRLSELGASLSVKRQPGDLFLSIAGTVGKPCIAGIKCCIHDGFVWFPSIGRGLLRDWLFAIFESGFAYAGLGKMGTQLNLNTDTVGSIRVPIPPAEEMQAVLRSVAEAKAANRALASHAGEHIDRLREYRSSLISAAVTGQLDISTFKLKEAA